MNFSIVTLTNEDLTQYKVDMQEAFQNGFEDVFGKTEDIILPERDINHSLKAKGSVAYKAVVDGEMVGGAIVVIDEEAQHNHLDLFYVKKYWNESIEFRYCYIENIEAVIYKYYNLIICKYYIH